MNQEMPAWRGKKSKWGHLVCFALVFTAGLFSLLLKKQQSNGYWSLHFSNLCKEISGTLWGQHWPDLLYPPSIGGYGQHCRCWTAPHGDLNLSSPHCAGDAMLKAVLEESLKLFICKGWCLLLLFSPMQEYLSHNFCSQMESEVFQQRRRWECRLLCEATGQVPRYCFLVLP